MEVYLNKIDQDNILIAEMLQSSCHTVCNVGMKLGVLDEPCSHQELDGIMNMAHAVFCASARINHAIEQREQLGKAKSLLPVATEQQGDAKSLSPVATEQLGKAESSLPFATEQEGKADSSLPVATERQGEAESFLSLSSVHYANIAMPKELSAAKTPLSGVS
eukprot:gene15400-16973_t